MKNKYKLMTLLLLTSIATLGQAQETRPRISIAQIVSHPALDADYQGIIDGLKEAGYVDGETADIDYSIAQADMAIASQIASNFIGKQPTVLVGISTPSAQSLIAAARGKYPIIFTAVTDPVVAKLVKNNTQPGANVSGVSDAVPLAKNMDMILEIIPSAKRIGTIYNPGEANSIAANAQLKQALTDRKMTLIDVPALNSGEVLTAAQSLVGKVDALFITTDNTVVSAFSSVLKVAEKNKIPVFTADTSSVKEGAIAALGFSYYDIGKATAKQIVAVLSGESVGELPVTFLKNPQLYLNPAAAERIHLVLPKSVVDHAAHIIEETN